MKTLTDSFKQAIAETKYLYAAYLAPMPPAKVRAAREQQGWKFSYEKPTEQKTEQKPSGPSSTMSAYADNLSKKKTIDESAFEPAPFAFANPGFNQYPKLVITNRQGQNIYDAGSAAIEHYEEELKKAARKVYLSPKI